MKKYRVTDKHPEIQEKVILSPEGDTYYSASKAIAYDTEQIERLLEHGWIEEIQQHEFTRDDMINFCTFFESLTGTPHYRNELDKWIKENKKC